MKHACRWALDVLNEPGGVVSAHRRCANCNHVMGVHGLDGVCDICDVESAIDAVASQLNDLT